MTVLLLITAFVQAPAELDPAAVEWFRKGEALIGTADEFSEHQAACFKNAVLLAPAFTAARFNLVLVYLRRQDLEAALDHCNELVSRSPGDVRNIQLRAQILSKKGAVDKAVADLEKAAQLAPDNNEVLQDLGRLLYKELRLEESLAAFEKAIGLQPTQAETYFEIALVQQGLRRYADAEGNCHRFLETYPDDFRANFLLGVVLRQQGKNEAALRYLLRAESLNPEDPDLATEMADLYMDLGNLVEAKKRLEKKRETPAGDLFSFGVIAKNQGEWEEAARYFRAVLKEEPENGEIWGHLGDVFLQMGRNEEAADAYRTAVEKDPDDFNSMLNLATLYAREQRSNEAMRLLSRAIELNPDSGQAYLNLAIVQETLGDEEAAQANYLKANEKGERSPLADFRLMYLYARKSRVDEALHHLALAFEGNARKYVPVVMEELKKVNSDLDSIRYTPRFAQLLQQYRTEFRN